MGWPSRLQLPAWMRAGLYAVGALAWLPGLGLFMDWEPLWGIPTGLVLLTGILWCIAAAAGVVVAFAQPTVVERLVGGALVLGILSAALLLYGGCWIAGFGGEPCLG